jgi:hypothetical protein
MDKPLHLSDSQLEQILRAAAPLAPEDHSPILEDVAARILLRLLGGTKRVTLPRGDVEAVLAGVASAG